VTAAKCVHPLADPRERRAPDATGKLKNVDAQNWENVELNPPPRDFRFVISYFK